MSGKQPGLMRCALCYVRVCSLAALFVPFLSPGNPAYGQQPAPGSDGQGASSAAAPPAAAPLIEPVNYLNPDPDARLKELEQTVAKQQQQIKDLVSQMHSGGSPAGGAAQIPGADTMPDVPPSTSIYPGGAAPPPPGAPIPTSPYVVGSDRSLFGSWTNDGPYFRSKNGDFTFHPRFVTQLDWIGVHAPGSGVTIPGGNAAGSQDSIDFRRLRVGADGTMWDTIDYVMEWDFAFGLINTEPTSSSLQTTGLRNVGTLNGGQQGGNVTNVIQPTTVFLTFKEMPLLENVRVGNQQDWLSLEHIESARFQDFMERSVLMDSFNGPNNNGYTPGISTFRTYFDQNVAVQLGAYRANYYDSGFPYDIGNNNYSYGGRMHWTPYYDEATNGRYLVHLGVGGQYRHFNTELATNQNGDNVRLRARGDLRNGVSVLGPNFADTGNFYATGQGLINPEFAVVWGPWLFQGEYEVSYMTNAATTQGGTGLGPVVFKGGYVETLYFLTGENRQYQRVSGVFGRVIPNSNAFFVKRAGFSKGAWQVGARYDWIDLNSGAINGGQNQNMTLGLNWWFNPNARLQFNYVYAHVNNTAAASPLSSGVTGALLGSKVTGTGAVSMLGTRIDFSF